MPSSSPIRYRHGLRPFSHLCCCCPGRSSHEAGNQRAVSPGPPCHSQTGQSQSSACYCTLRAADRARALAGRPPPPPPLSPPRASLRLHPPGWLQASSADASTGVHQQLDCLAFTLILDDIVSPTGESSMGRLGGGGPQVSSCAAAGCAWSASVGRLLVTACPLPRTAAADAVGLPAAAAAGSPSGVGGRRGPRPSRRLPGLAGALRRAHRRTGAAPGQRDATGVADLGVRRAPARGARPRPAMTRVHEGRAASAVL